MTRQVRHLLLALLLAALVPAGAQAKENALSAVAIGVEAYIYGYPLVSMELTRRVLTNYEGPAPKGAPMGQFTRMRTYPGPEDKQVTAPNADTLYTITWVDVSKEPWILSLPEANGRYYLFPMLDAWTTVFQSPGTRTTGTGPQKYAITGPNWKGTLPAGVKEYKSNTAIVWILGRIYCTGTPEDYAAVHKLQDEVSIVPLSAYGKPYTPPRGVIDPRVDMKAPVREQVNSMSAVDYFTLLAQLLKDNPPSPADKPMLDKMARIGIVPGKPFDPDKLGPLAKEVFPAVPDIALSKIRFAMKESVLTGGSKLENGWMYFTRTGEYGTDYLLRALTTYFGLGANLPQDAIYPFSEGPSLLKSYSGDKKYVMRFPKGQLPPVNGFWSLTMYDKDYYFVKNPIDRQSISARDSLKANPDGSVDIYIQHDNPGPDKESNWLPAPKEKFVLMMRLYWPKGTPPMLLTGAWKIPPVKEVTD